MKRNVIFRGTTPTLEIKMGRGIRVENIVGLIVYISQGITILKKRLEDVKINKTAADTAAETMIHFPLGIYMK